MKSVNEISPIGEPVPIHREGQRGRIPMTPATEWPTPRHHLPVGRIDAARRVLYLDTSLAKGETDIFFYLIIEITPLIGFSLLLGLMI